MDWEARMSMRTWTRQVLAEAEAITRDPEPEEGEGIELGTVRGFTVMPFGFTSYGWRLSPPAGPAAD